MNRSRLISKCECGGFAQPLSLWVTDEKSLLVTSYCIVCESQVNVIFPLTELFKSCPLPTFGEDTTRLLLPRAVEQWTDEDMQILRKAHIDPEGGGLE
jgi:hypothetical protein